MKRNQTHIPFWALPELEQTLDALSQEGQQLAGGVFRGRRYTPGDAACWYRIGCCDAKPGTAGAVEYQLRQTRLGWTFVCRQGRWWVFRRPLGEGEKPQLAGGRDAYCQLLRRRGRQLETGRLWCFVLTALLLIGGYALDRAWVTRLAALPLVVALGLSLLIQKLGRSREREEPADA